MRDISALKDRSIHQAFVHLCAGPGGLCAEHWDIVEGRAAPVSEELPIGGETEPGFGETLNLFQYPLATIIGERSILISCAGTVHVCYLQTPWRHSLPPKTMVAPPTGRCWSWRALQWFGCEVYLTCPHPTPSFKNYAARPLRPVICHLSG